jgi:hypothetical protein
MSATIGVSHGNIDKPDNSSGPFVAKYNLTPDQGKE